MHRSFFSGALRPVYWQWAHVHSLLSDLSLSPNLALTPMHAHMRGPRVHARSYMITEVPRKSRQLILNDIRSRAYHLTALLYRCRTSFSSKNYKNIFEQSLTEQDQKNTN